MEKKVLISLSENEVLRIVNSLYDSAEYSRDKYPATSAYMLELARRLYDVVNHA